MVAESSDAPSSSEGCTVQLKASDACKAATGSKVLVKNDPGGKGCKEACVKHGKDGCCQRHKGTDVTNGCVWFNSDVSPGYGDAYQASAISCAKKGMCVPACPLT